MSKYKHVITINQVTTSVAELALDMSPQNKQKHGNMLWSKHMCLADSFLEWLRLETEGTAGTVGVDVCINMTQLTAVISPLDSQSRLSREKVRKDK